MGLVKRSPLPAPRSADGASEQADRRSAPELPVARDDEIGVGHGLLEACGGHGG